MLDVAIQSIRISCDLNGVELETAIDTEICRSHDHVFEYQACASVFDKEKGALVLDIAACS